MLFGNPNDFAIEAMLEPNLIPPSKAWGRMCVHVESFVFGDYPQGYCGLWQAVDAFHWLRNHVDELWDEAFEGKSPQNIHDLVRHAIYGDDARTLEEIKHDAERFSRFDFLCNWGEQFDGSCSVIYRESPDRLRITHRPTTDMLVSVSCTVDGLVDACDQFTTWFNTEEKRLLGK